MHKNYRFADFKLNLGRSITEMLGTLAIIAILSIAAVSGIRYVLDKNTANAIMKEALTQASEIKLRRKKHTHTSGEIKYAYKSEYISSRTYGNSNTLILKAKGVSEGVCNKLVSEKEVSIFDSILTSNNDKTECKDANTIVFTTDTTTLDPGRVDLCANVTCCHGRCDKETGTCECEDGWEGEDCCTADCGLPTNVQTCATKENIVDDRGCILTQYLKVPCYEDEETCNSLLKLQAVENNFSNNKCFFGNNIPANCNNPPSKTIAFLLTVNESTIPSSFSASKIQNCKYP